MASDSPTLSISGDSSATELLSSLVSFLQAGGSVGKVISSALLGVIIQPALSTVNIIQAVVGFFTTPLATVSSAIGSLGNALFTQPGQLLAAGSEITEQALRGAIGDSLAGVLALPITVLLVLGSVYLFVRFLQQPATGDVPIPGSGLDVPSDILGVEENEEQ